MKWLVQDQTHSKCLINTIGLPSTSTGIKGCAAVAADQHSMKGVQVGEVEMRHSVLQETSRIDLQIDILRS